MQGAGGGTVGVIQAYVADATAPEERAKALGWLSAATNAGVAFGPLLGSLSLLGGHSGPGLVAAGLCIVNMLFAWRYSGVARHEGCEGGCRASAAPRARRSRA